MILLAGVRPEPVQVWFKFMFSFLGRGLFHLYLAFLTLPGTTSMEHLTDLIGMVGGGLLMFTAVVLIYGHFKYKEDEDELNKPIR